MPNYKILVVDDEKDLVEVLTLRLEGSGFKVIVAYDGGEALKKVKEENPDLIILDIVMPVMDGFEVLARLRRDAQTKDTPVIVLTCKGESKAIFKAQSLGATDYLIKPFEPSELLDAIKEYI
jgi:DNA-binding response OmpR family regulator